MKNKIKNFIYNINFPDFFYKNAILIESSPDFSDNSKYLFNEIIKRNLNNKYKIIWLVDCKRDRFSNFKEKNVCFLDRNEKNIIKKIRLSIFKIFSKYIIDSNKYIHKSNKKQVRFFLTHGTPIKMSYEYCNLCGDLDYLIVCSNFFIDISSDLYKVDKEKIVVTGFPRNDAIYNEEKKVLFPNISRKKTILWMPTYRNHKYTNSYAARTDIRLKYGVPCIENEEQLKKLNNVLAERNILLLIKYHHADDVKIKSGLNISNIKFFDDSYFENNNTTIYDYLNSIDSLITDYSSIYYDYLLTDNNIGLTIPDLDAFSEHVKLIGNDYKKYIKGFYIYNIDDLIEFVTLNKNDKNDDIRNAKYMFHKYFDGLSSSRVCDLLEKEMRKNSNEK